jgi:hypothetical protein
LQLAADFAEDAVGADGSLAPGRVVIERDDDRAPGPGGTPEQGGLLTGQGGAARGQPGVPAGIGETNRDGVEWPLDEDRYRARGQTGADLLPPEQQLAFAAIYLSALADQVARANGMPVVTDQISSYGTLNGWSLDTLASVLLTDESETPDADRPEGGIASLYAAIAIKAAVPAGIEALPAEKIVEIRHKLAPEFDAFCAHLDSLTGQFTELARIEDPGILHARLTIMAERDLLRPTADLDRGLRALKLQPARAVMAMKSLELPAVTAAAVSGVGLPVAAGQAGMAAAQFIASSIQARQIAEERRRSAAGYLLGIRGELSPTGVVARVRRMFRRAARYQRR